MAKKEPEGFMTDDQKKKIEEEKYHMKINITHNKTVNIKKTNTMDGFTKYVPPHMRKRNSKNRNKKTSNWNDVNSNSEAGIFLNSKFLDKF